MSSAGTAIALGPEAGTNEPLPEQDQFVYLHLDWQGLLDFLRLKGDRSVPRITYLDGTLELMSPSTKHEGYKKHLARLVEMYCWLVRVPVYGYGSWTLKTTETKRGAVEPDECYVRDTEEVPDRPDLAIEVVHTSGGLSKEAGLP